MNINTILVGLDLTDMDESLISYALLMSKSYKAENVYFLHVERNLELPEEVMKDYNDVIATVDEGIRHQIEQKIKTDFPKDIETEIMVEEGDAVDRILRIAKIKNADLLILGRKEKLKGKGVVTHTLARKSPCDLLLVPEKKVTQLVDRVLVPIDFSEHSKLAMQLATSLAHTNQALVSCVHVYDVPTGYSKIGKSFKEFAEIMLKHAKKSYQQFIKDFDEDTECNFVLSKDHEYSDELIDYIQATRPDIVFIGSKGGSNAAIALLGSMSEKLITTIYRVPLYIAKKKGESMTIFEALLRL